MSRGRLWTLRYGVPALAVAMLAFALWSVMRADRPPEQADPPMAPAASAFPRSVAGTGIVEPSSEVIAVATELGGVITNVFVVAGDKVAAKQPLFSIDDRIYRAAVDQARATVEAQSAAIANIDSQLELQHAVIDRASAAVDSAVAERDRAASDRKRYVTLSAADFASRQRLESAAADDRKADAGLVGARAALVSARRQLPVLGAARKEAEARLTEAQAALARAETDLDRTVVRAPITGAILKVNVRLGEYAQPGVLANALVTMGAVDPMHVRVEVDETDAHRINPTASAMAELRGDPSVRTPLTFVRIEPQVIPKRALNGAPGERVDMRVLQVIYRFDPAAFPAFSGQEVDVFIEAPDRVQAKAR